MTDFDKKKYFKNEYICSHEPNYFGRNGKLRRYCPVAIHNGRNKFNYTIS